MNKEEFATLLNGRSYRDEMSREEQEIAKVNDLIVIFGASDDLVEFRGAIYDEIDAYDGCDFIIATPGTEIPVDERNETYRKAKVLEAVPVEQHCSVTKNRFKALWCPAGLDCSWLIKTDLPHAPFDILEDGELYCRGLVIEVSSLS